MFNAEEIIEIEKKWLKYKIKQKSKYYIIFIVIVAITSGVFYQFNIKKKSKNDTLSKTKIIEKKLIIKKEPTETKREEYEPITPISTSESNTTTINPLEKKLTITKEVMNINKNITKTNEIEKINTKSYYLKLEPRVQGNELFSSNSFLSFNSPIEKKLTPFVKENNIILPIREIQKKEIKPIKEKKKSAITIDIKDMDTIVYLKEKFYATSSIVFALMLSEEFYYNKNYNESLKWALTANDIDSQNTKTWYWFAKSKIKLNKKEDAIRALKAYLSNNESKRLSTLLRKIELGDTND